jgi:hypothetical protein
MSDGTEMALPGNGSALRAAQASSHAAALRDVMKTLEQPAWMRLGWVLVVDRIEPTEGVDIPRSSVKAQSSRTASDNCYFAI